MADSSERKGEWWEESERASCVFVRRTEPAAVTACRQCLSCTSPPANTPCTGR